MAIAVTAARIALVIGAALTIGACKPSQEPTAPPNAETPRPAPEPRADLPDEQRSPDLFGTWLIESVAAPGPRPQDRSWDMILLVGNRQLEVLSQCVTIGPFDYGRTVGGGIRVSAADARPPSPPAASNPSPIQCARALSLAEQALPPILLAAREVKRGPGGTVTLTGEAGSIVMRRPASALANPRGQMPPPSAPPPLGTWRVLALNSRGVPANQGMEMLLRPHHIEWRSGCVNEGRALRRDRDLLLPGQVDPFPVCERGRSEAERAMERLLSGTIAARMAPNGRLVLQGSDVTAELAPFTG